ncbi:MAG: class I SAM-dependent methyltransferase [Myxococcales bacterium]|nr:class I SAM-dependent methyltransferase [Myxococcales bacterium]
MSPADLALVELGRLLRRSGHRFVPPTPATHRHVDARPGNAEARALADVLGWSRPFGPGVLPPEVEALLVAADALAPAGRLRRATVRFASVDPPPEQPGQDPAIYVHSAHPTAAADAVFFGPDTYRFIRVLRRAVAPARRLVEVCAGSGAPGLSLVGRAGQVVLTDINERALRFARINAAIADAPGVLVLASDLLAGVRDDIDAVVAHPPFMRDPARRLYRDGGGDHGYDLAVRIVREALVRLRPGGQLVLFTGSPVIAGRHPLHAALAPVLAGRACQAAWEEVDPDVYGEELASDLYADVDRIALVALVVHVQ